MHTQGWGVRTMDEIPSGSFVLEYVGEIINNEMAEVSLRRSHFPRRLLLMLSHSRRVPTQCR
jgi:SET domain-containing protein